MLKDTQQHSSSNKRTFIPPTVATLLFLFCEDVEKVWPRILASNTEKEMV